MNSKRKRKYNEPIKVNSTIKKVFRTYGQDVEEETAPNIAHTVGRKQRRRENKKEKKVNKLKHFQHLSKKHEEKEGVKIPVKDLPVNEEKRPKKERKKTLKQKKKKSIEKENEKEDQMISTLEKKLYLNKRKSKKLPKSFTDAGLDYILNVVGRGAVDDNSEDIFFINEKQEKNLTNQNEVLDKGEELEEDCVISENADVDESGSISDKENSENLHPIRRASENGDGSEDEGGSSTDEGISENLNQSHRDFEIGDVNEDEDGSSCDEGIPENPNQTPDDDSFDHQTSEILTNSTRYVPPAMRVQLSIKQEENIKQLKRKVKGLLNKLSATNISSICGEIESLYREGSRAVMHRVLTEAIMELFCAPDQVPDILVAENAMLVAVLSARVSIEVLMHFYETVSLKLHSLFFSKDEDDGKASNNLLQLLGCLYQLKVVDCKVVLDVFRLLIESFMEKDVELTLEILNKVGFQLRKDEPEALRDIIKVITLKCEEMKISANDGSRMAYMLSVLMAVKNNNIRKVTGFNQEVVIARRKKLASLTKNCQGDGSTNTMPPVALQDFLDVESNGRWWIVGSSFTGRPMLRDQIEEQSQETDIDESVSKKVADAAKRQRMNTDVRRKIFYAIMTADDFVDAFQKVMKCGLKGKQLREIATVIVDCCQQEKSFNPYYLHLLNRFCQHDRQFVISLQCTIWDRFKVLESLKMSQIDNTAKLLTQLVIMESLPLNCLKAINFTEMDKTMVYFLRLFLCTLAHQSSGIEHLKTIFDGLRASSKTKLVRQGLHLFLQYFMLADEKFMTKYPQLRDHFKAMLSSVEKASSTFL